MDSNHHLLCVCVSEKERESKRERGEKRAEQLSQVQMLISDCMAIDIPSTAFLGLHKFTLAPLAMKSKTLRVCVCVHARTGVQKLPLPWL